MTIASRIVSVYGHLTERVIAGAALLSALASALGLSLGDRLSGLRLSLDLFCKIENNCFVFKDCHMYSKFRLDRGTENVRVRQKGKTLTLRLVK